MCCTRLLLLHKVVNKAMLPFSPVASWSYPPCKPPSAGVGGVGGSCVFWLSCYHSGGEHLGICRNGFLFGTCYRLKRHLKPPKPPPPPTEAALAGDAEGDKNTVRILSEISWDLEFARIQLFIFHRSTSSAAGEAAATPAKTFQTTPA